ncbi:MULTISPECIES: AAA family ATPase [unclassified Bradyrhizobium]
MKAGNPDEVAVQRRVKDILAKAGVARIGDLSENACGPVIVALREALVEHLATIAPVVPLPKNCKSPPPPGWPKLATQDVDVLRKLVRQRPGCNWGLSTNVIDVDSKDPKPGKRRGTEVWAELVAQYGEPDTLKTVTPSGGSHYFVADDLPNTEHGIGDGIDTRGAGIGYVVAPGSYVVADGDKVRETGFYRAVTTPAIVVTGLASVPWAVERIGARVSTDTVERGLAAEVELDTDAAIEQAIDLLQSYATSPREVDRNGKQINGPAIEGEGGDGWTVQVAMNVGDLGVSREMCLELMAEHFNPACEPPWLGDDEGDTKDRLSTKVNSAYNSREKPPGSDSAEAEFGDDLVEDADELVREEPPAVFKPTPFKAFDPKTIAPRDWLYASHYIRKYVVADVAPGGGGKSSVVLAEAVAMALGKDLLETGKVYHRRLKVWYWNGEDPEDEIKRRVAAICIRYKVDMAALDSWLFIDSGRKVPIKLAQTVNGSATKIAKPQVEGLIKAATDSGIDCLIIDPFVSSHSLTENDNNAIDAVIKEGWVQIAERGNCCVDLVHHTRKVGRGQEVGASDSRGASAMVDAARDVRTFNPMTGEEADKLGIVDSERWRYIRVASDKPNMSARGAVSPWRMLDSVMLDNKTADFPADSVGVAVPWKPEEVDELQADVKREKIASAFLALLDDGTRVTKQYGGDMTQADAAKTLKVSKADLQSAIDGLRRERRIRYVDAGKKRLAGWERVAAAVTGPGTDPAE